MNVDTKHTVLLTGATGFLGAYVLERLLKKGYRVRALRRKDSPLDMVADINDQVEWIEGDVTDVVSLEDAFQGITHVLHCAAMVSFHPRDALRMNQINTTGTGNIVNLSLEYGVKKLVHVSSIASLGRSKERTTLNEDSMWVQSPSNTRYAVSKYLSEQEVWRGHAEGLSVAIANPAVILGAGFWHAGTCKLFRQVDQGLRFWSIGRSGFVDVRDVADFLLLLLEQEINGERYVLSAQNYTFRELFSDIALALDRKPPSVKVTPMLAEVAWRVEWLKEKLLGAEPVVTKESARSSLNQFLYENDKSLQVPGFQYRNLADTIRETASAYLHAKQNGLKANRLNP